MGNLDLIDWTIETAKQLRAPDDMNTSAAVDGGEAILKSDDWLLMSGADTELNPQRPVTEPSAGRASDEPSTHVSSEPSVIETATVQPEPATLPADAHAALLQAIVHPDIYTSRADRHRAIDLRWSIRDIAADRLKSSPISKRDLQILIDMKLVELRDGVPHLTNAGVTAIV